MDRAVSGSSIPAVERFAGLEDKEVVPKAPREHEMSEPASSRDPSLR